MLIRSLIVAAALLTATAAQAEVWRGSWGASPTRAMVKGQAGVPDGWPTSPVIADQTVVQQVRLSAGGERIRIRLTNEYGEAPLKIGRVRVGLADGAMREVRFAGAESAVIPPGAPLLSDPVDLPVPALAKLKVAIYFPGAAGPCTCHGDGRQEAQISPPGDHTDKPFAAVATTGARTFLSGVEVESARAAPVVVAFGDSITDGALSTPNTDRRWPDRLAERLAAASGPQSRTAVVNAGIGGNRVLTSSNIPMFGDPALARLDRDVFAVPGVTHLIVLEGVNDLGGRPTPSAESMIAGFRQIIARAHTQGIKVLLATIVPYEGAAYFRPEGEAARQAINSWIRSQKDADGVVDFDLATRDPARPARMRADFHAGDWLHPNDAGYRAMGDAVPLSLLR